MASSSSNLDLISESQAGKATTANELFNAGSPATLFGRRNSTSTGLTWGYYGGQMVVDGVLTTISNSTVSLSASTTNYVESTRAGVVSKNTTGFTLGSIPLYTVVAGASSVTTYTDNRAWVQPLHITSKASVAVTAADVTLTQAQAACRYLTTTGAITGANRNVIVPNDWEGIVYCNNTGAFTTTFKTSGGSGIVVAQTKRAHLLADGTNVVRITADV
jgi:hypothetical protein